MFVCICKAVTDKKIKELAAEGCRTTRAVSEKCGAGSECGSCIFEVNRLLQEEKAPVETESAVEAS